MTVLLSMLFVAAFTLDYLATKLGLVSKLFTLIPEFFSLLIALTIIGRSLVLRHWEQPTRYVWFFVVFILVCMIGIVAQSVDAGPLISGLRNYFKFLPMLFLPAVYEFSEKQLRIFLGVFFLMAALQVPLSFFQRFVQFADRMHTGDPITGSVTASSALTMVVCLAIALVITLYIHRKIALSLAVVLFCFLAAPTAINETKATLLLLPVAVLGPFILARGVAGRWRKAVPILGICVFGLVAFATIYNTLIEARWEGTGITDFFGASAYEAYLYRGSAQDDFVHNIGRLDSVILPINILSDDWMQLLFGLGIGNASPSSLPGMEGAYFELAKDQGFGMTAIGNLIWETGVTGLLLYLLLFGFIWRDTRRCAKVDLDNESGWYCTWWSTCIVLFVFGLAYKSVLELNELGYMLFFWSGVIVSRYWRIRHSSDSAPAAQEQIAPRLQLAGR